MSRDRKHKIGLLPRLFLLGLALLAITVAGALWRDSSFVVTSTKEAFLWFSGSHRPWSLVDALLNAAIIAATIILILWVLVPWKRRHGIQKAWRKSTKSTRNLGNEGYGNSTIDQLDRYQLARDIAGSLVGEASTETNLVVGIEAAWGQGKTTVLDWVWHELERRRPPPILVKFDPWPEESKRGVVARLLDEIANAICARNDIPGSEKLQISDVFTRIANAAAKEKPLSFGAAFNFLKWLAFPDRHNYPLRPLTAIAADREDLGKLIGRLQHRLIVFVDDLDRIDGTDLRVSLMAISALSSFRNTTFVVAYDPTVVDAALENQGLASTHSKFREKIISLSIPIPPAAFPLRKALFEKSLETELESRLATSTWRHWPQGTTASAVLKTVEVIESPRSLKRLASNAAFIVAKLGKEVNAADVLLLELLRAHYSEIWQYLRARKNGLDEIRDTNATRQLITNEEQPTPIEVVISSLRTAWSSEQIGTVRSILEMLFPNYSNTYRSLSQEEATRDSRVQIAANLKKYFQLGVDADGVPDEILREWLYVPNSRERITEEFIMKGMLGTLFSRAALHVDESSELPDGNDLIHLITGTAAKSWQSLKANVTGEAAALLHRIVSATPEEQQFAGARQIAVSNNLSVSESFTRNLLYRAGLWRDGRMQAKPPSVDLVPGQIFQDDQLHDLRRLWLDAARARGVQSIYDSEAEPTSIMFRWAQLGTPEDGTPAEVRSALGEFLQEEGNLVNFVSQFSEKIRGANFSISGVENLISDWENFLARVTSLAEPADAIEKFQEALDRLGN